MSGRLGRRCGGPSDLGLCGEGRDAGRVLALHSLLSLSVSRPSKPPNPQPRPSPAFRSALALVTRSRTNHHTVSSSAPHCQTPVNEPRLRRAWAASTPRRRLPGRAAPSALIFMNPSRGGLVRVTLTLALALALALALTLTL
jgi:hypothetical protein